LIPARAGADYETLRAQLFGIERAGARASRAVIRCHNSLLRDNGRLHLNGQQLDCSITAVLCTELAATVLTAPDEQLVRVHRMPPSDHRHGLVTFERLQHNLDFLLDRPTTPPADRSTPSSTHA